MNTSSVEIAFDPALNMARQSLYRFAALALLDPKAGSWDRLNELRSSALLEESAALIRSEPAAAAKPLGRGELPLTHLDPAVVLRRLPESPAALNTTYERTFGLLVSNACPPYETEYINGKFTFQRSNALGDISGFYRAFGLTTSELLPERHDHVVLELEFMAFLLGLERQAADDDARDRCDKVQICRDAQTRFLREHLAWWTPAFARLLGRENSGGFYESVGQFLAALIPAERSLLGVDSTSDPVAPSTLEHPEECEGCQLNPDAVL